MSRKDQNIIHNCRNLVVLLAVWRLHQVEGVRSEANNSPRLDTVAEICLNVNTATGAELKKLNGIGKALAKKLTANQPHWDETSLPPVLQGNSLLTFRLQDQDIMICSPDSLPDPIKKRTLADPCLDVNEATLYDLQGLGLSLKDATAFLSIREEAKCFTDLKHMKDVFMEYPHGKRIYEEHMDVEIQIGLVCISNELLSQGCDPEPIKALHKKMTVASPQWTIALDDCKQALPQERMVQEMQRDFNNEDMRFATYGPSGWTIHEGSAEEAEMCKESFPYLQHKLAAVPRAIPGDASLGVCMLVRDSNKEAPTHFMYSEYNTARGIPNFVAFQVVDFQNTAKTDMLKCRKSWKLVCPSKRGAEEEEEAQARCRQLVDRPFEPANLVRDICDLADGMCSQRADQRGHMNPAAFNHWNEARCKATMSYLNAFPSRSDFDSGPWNFRELAVLKYLKSTRSRGRVGSVWMVVGVSNETDGELKSSRTFLDEGTKSNVDVPTYVWSAIFDPLTKKATGWICRNGLTGSNCNCVDELSVNQLQMRVGFKIFPHLEGEEDVDLNDGSLDVFWDLVH